MHTPEQAKELWCPMARVAQAGQIDTAAAYNRTLTKSLNEVSVAVHDNFKLGQSPAPEKRIMVAIGVAVDRSMAANCVANQCAMWRTHSNKPDLPERGYCGLAPLATI